MEIFSVSQRQVILPGEIRPQEGASPPQEAILPQSKNTDPPSQREGSPVQEMPQTEEVVARLQEYIDRMNVSLTFSTYGSNGERISVAVIEKETGKTVREIPSEELQNLYMKMQELVGMIFSETA